MAERAGQPDNTAVRVALWRALHVAVDAPPHVLVDEVGLRLAAPDAGWRQRPDMHPERTSRNRASIVARARYVEELVAEQAAAGVAQYVLLGAGLDTFAQRHPELGDRLRVFEVDQPVTQAWKRQRLAELGYAAPDGLRFVPVDFEAGASWWDELAAAGFDTGRPAVVSSAGVSMYLTVDAVDAMLRQAAALTQGSALVLSFLVPLALVDRDEHPALQGAERGARAAGTPWLSFFAPDDLLDRARRAGFRTVRHVSHLELAERWFAGRADGLRPSSAEQLLVATT